MFAIFVTYLLFGIEKLWPYKDLFGFLLQSEKKGCIFLFFIHSIIPIFHINVYYLSSLIALFCINGLRPYANLFNFLSQSDKKAIFFVLNAFNYSDLSH